MLTAECKTVKKIEILNYVQHQSLILQCVAS